MRQRRRTVVRVLEQHCLTLSQPPVVPPRRRTHLAIWREMVEKDAASSKVFPWSLRQFETIARLTYIEGKPFVVQFFRETGELASAFKPNSGQLREMLRLINLAK